VSALIPERGGANEIESKDDVRTDEKKLGEQDRYKSPMKQTINNIYLYIYI